MKMINLLVIIILYINIDANLCNYVENVITQCDLMHFLHALNWTSRAEIYNVPLISVINYNRFVLIHINISFKKTTE